MIEFLSGKLKCRLPSSIILDVNGVGYGVDLPLPVICDMPAVGRHVELWVYTRVKEDSLKLYGFLSFSQRQTFEVLINISGVGPKVALAIMSTINVSTLKYAVQMSEPEILEVVPGIGKRTAEKILLELKPKVDKLVAPTDEALSSGLSVSASSGDDASKVGQSVELGTAEVPVAIPGPLNFRPGNGGDSDRFEAAENLMTVKSDLNSALANLGFKDKDIKKSINSAIAETSSHDFSLLLKSSLHFLRGGLPNRASRNDAHLNSTS